LWRLVYLIYQTIKQGEEMKVYNVGDKVWVSRCGVENVSEVCPVCFGNKVVHLTLGNGSILEMECSNCNIWGTSSGFVTEQRWVAGVSEIVLDKVSVSSSFDGQEVSYQSGPYLYNSSNVFDNEEDALIYSKKMKDEMEKNQREQNRAATNQKNKSYASFAAYHTREANKAKKQMEYHQSKAKEIKGASK
jgi:hypothetical protein